MRGRSAPRKRARTLTQKIGDCAAADCLPAALHVVAGCATFNNGHKVRRIEQREKHVFLIQERLRFASFRFAHNDVFNNENKKRK